MGLLQPIFKQLASPSKTPSIIPKPIEGEVLGGELVPKTFGVGSTRGTVVDGEIIEDVSKGFPYGKAAAGAGGVGALTAGGLMMGGDETSPPSPSKTDTGTELTPIQETMLEGTNHQVNQGGKNVSQIENEIRATIPKKDQGWFDSLAGEFDLVTVGLALLATNNGKGTFAENLGNSLMAGRAAVQKRKALDIKTASDAAREGRAERTTALEEMKARAVAKNADTARLQAENTAIKYAATANGVQLGTPSTQQLGEVSDLADLVTGKEGVLKTVGKNRNSTDAAIGNMIASQIELEEKRANASGRTLTFDQKKAIVAEKLGPYLKDTSFFGIPTGKGFDRDEFTANQQQSSQQQQLETEILQRITDLSNK